MATELDYKGFLSDLRKALVHLDDPAYLESLELANQIGRVIQSVDLSSGQHLRRILRVAIGALDPGTDRTTNAIEARCYQVLYRYAISKESILTIANKLDIGERQAYRELHRAISGLAGVLKGIAAESGATVEASTEERLRAAKAHKELQRFAALSEQDVDLGRLVLGIVENVERLAQERGVRIRVCDQSYNPHVVANRVMLRQALLNLLSHIVTTTQHGGQALLQLQQIEGRALVEFIYRPEVPFDASTVDGPYAMCRELLNMLSLAWTRTDRSDETVCISIWVPLLQKQEIMIVDDNDGVIALFRRYLHRQPYHIHSAHNIREAKAIWETSPIAVIILDIMLPNEDGWEVLQAIQASHRGPRPSVIICSIINDPQLATALGADVFLHKPVSQASLLQALQKLLPPPRSQA